MSIGVLSWTNETSLTPYPLAKSFGYDNFLVDANFVQFDNFIPVLKGIQLVNGYLNITILFDLGAVTTSVAVADAQQYRFTQKIFSADRYMGKLIFGPDTNLLVDSNIANLTTLQLNIPFLSHLVRGIPSKAGVFSVDSKFGALAFTSHSEIWYDTSGNNVTFNAVAGIDYNVTPYLKTLNTITPTHNGVYIEDNQVLKIRSTGTATLEASIVGSELSAINRPISIITTNG